MPHKDATRLIASATRRGGGRRPVSPPIERASTMLSDRVGDMRDESLGPLYGLDGTRKAAFTGHVNSIRTVRWSPDGKALVSFAPNDPVRLWTVADDLQVTSVLPTNDWLALTSIAVDRARGFVAAGDTAMSR